jgi:hypothetical protein
VVFDTNVIERYYLAPLLRGEPCRDFQHLREHAPAYTPALCIKSFYEICHHVKYGTKRFPWMRPELGYPGGLDEGRRILRNAPHIADDPNLYWRFGLCEEWRFLDWDQEVQRVLDWVREEERDVALHEVEVRRQFSAWKFALTAFCERIWDVLAQEMVFLSPQDAYGSALQHGEGTFRVEQELATYSIVPSEDLDLVAMALLLDAAAFVTCEEKILSATALSLSRAYTK